jgi:hypothetical protein
MAARRSPNRRSDWRDRRDRPDRRAALTQYAEDHDFELVFFDPPQYFDQAIVGLVLGYGQMPAVLYDEAKVLAAMVADGMTTEDAEEWFAFNTIGTYAGEATPRFLIWRADEETSDA